jgi:transposase
MPGPFKKDPIEYNQRQLLPTNVFDLLPGDHDCFVYEDIFSQIDTKNIEEKYSMIGQHAYHPRRVTAILIYAYSQGSLAPERLKKDAEKIFPLCIYPTETVPTSEYYLTLEKITTISF